MKKVTPYKTVKNALVSLDNGGRFYNIFTSSDDGEIEHSELAKVAGVFGNKQKMILYLEMSLFALSESDQEKVKFKLSTDLKSIYRKYRPVYMTPASAANGGKPASSVIVKGIPKFMEETTEFTGMLLMPMYVGNQFTMLTVPIREHFDLYEVTSSQNKQEFLIARAKRQKRLKQKETVFGGVIKEIKPAKGKPQKHKVFLDACYYI